MSKSALADAYAAGFRDGRQSAATVRDDEAADHCALGFDDWWMQSNETLDRNGRLLTADEKVMQGRACSCGGADDYCPCQNVRLR